MLTPLIYNLMTQDQNQRLLDAIEGRDIADVIAMLSAAGNRYSRRILRFFRWFCKWVPLVLMLTHFYGVTDFARNPHEMFVVHDENAACYAFLYFMVYILPMVVIVASRFFRLCLFFRLPFFYLFGVNAIHLCYWNWYTTPEMVMPHYCLMTMIAAIYLYAAIGWACNNTRIGRRLFA